MWIVHCQAGPTSFRDLGELDKLSMTLQGDVQAHSKMKYTWAEIQHLLALQKLVVLAYNADMYLVYGHNLDRAIENGRMWHHSVV